MQDAQDANKQDKKNVLSFVLTQPILLNSSKNSNKVRIPLKKICFFDDHPPTLALSNIL